MRRKTIMKNTLAALLLLCSTTPALAQDKVKLTSNEGETVWFTLGQDLDKAEVPYVIFDMTINKAMATLLQLPIAVILSVSMQIGRSNSYPIQLPA